MTVQLLYSINNFKSLYDINHENKTFLKKTLQRRNQPLLDHNHVNDGSKVNKVISNVMGLHFKHRTHFPRLWWNTKKKLLSTN